MSRRIEIEMFSRPDCHLCETALKVIENLQGRYPVILKVTNVEQDPELEEKYGAQVPVVRIGGNKTFEYPIEPADLERELERFWTR